MPSHPPLLALTLGDPAGIGPELVLMALADPSVRKACVPVVYGNLRLLERVAARAGIPWPPAHLTLAAPGQAFRPAAGSALLLDFPFPAANTLRPGRVDAVCGAQAHAWIEAAARDALSGKVAALVTAPINKEALHLAGIRHPGHTEILAELTGVREAVMLFWSSRLIVSLATIHTPLADVPRHLTRIRVLMAIRLTAAAMRAAGRPAARIGVLALNPHAGEQGLFGAEEARIITPAIRTARSEGIDAAGPLVPDTAFTWLGSNAAAPARPAPCGAYVAMYHDQGLIPFKLAAFDEGVNVTLGLPIIRTSPDHGTAFDLAWQGRASPSSLLAAIHCALRLAGSGRSRKLRLPH